MFFSYRGALGLIVMLTFCLFGVRAHAQISQESLDLLNADTTTETDISDADIYETGPTSDDIDVDISPENPGIFTNVAIHLSSDLVDLNRYKITWIVDGKVMQSGIGIRDINAVTKNYGERTVVQISVALPGGTVQKQVALEPQDMALLWEAADSYVPAFYPGKKLPGREGFMKIVSIPNFQTAGKSFNPATGVYTWKRNGNVVGSSSGYGKQSFLFQNNRIRGTEEIQVTASDVANGSQAIRTIVVPTFNQKILFYEKNPTSGIVSPLATSTIYLTEPSTNVVAEPYFFSASRNNPANLALEWTMNGTPLTVSDKKDPEILTLNNPGGKGVATLGLSISNPNTVFQSAQSVLNVVFNKK